MRAEAQAVIPLIVALAGVNGSGAQEQVTDPGMSVEQRLDRIDSALSNQGLLEMVQQLHALEMEVNRLRGETETLNHALEQLKKRQRDMYTDMDMRIQRFEDPDTTLIGAAPANDEPPLQTLSPFAEAEPTGAAQAETPLTLELVGQESDRAGAGIQPLATVPDQSAAQPGIETAPPPTTGTSRTQEAIAPLTAPSDEPPQQAIDPALAPGPAPAQEMALSGPREDISAVTPTQQPAAPGMSASMATGALEEASPEQIAAEYQDAFNLLKQSLYERSVTAFREFLARHPNSEHAGNAQFWLAEAHYVNGYFEQALVEYNTLAQRYPDSRKLSQAKLKAAFCQYELGRVDPARQRLVEIIQQYPDTTAASLAQNKLAEIAAAATLPVE